MSCYLPAAGGKHCNKSTINWNSTGISRLNWHELLSPLYVLKLIQRRRWQTFTRRAFHRQVFASRNQNAFPRCWQIFRWISNWYPGTIQITLKNLHAWNVTFQDFEAISFFVFWGYFIITYLTSQRSRKIPWYGVCISSYFKHKMEPIKWLVYVAINN